MSLVSFAALVEEHCVTLISVVGLEILSLRCGFYEVSLFVASVENPAEKSFQTSVRSADKCHLPE